MAQARVKALVREYVNEFLDGHTEDLRFDVDTRLFSLLDEMIGFLKGKFPSWPALPEDHHEARDPEAPTGIPGALRQE